MRKILIGTAVVGAGVGSYLYLTSVSEYVIPIQYPTNIITSNYWWDLQSSTNLSNWVTERYGLGPGDVLITNDGTDKFFRMRGRP